MGRIGKENGVLRVARWRYSGSSLSVTMGNLLCGKTLFLGETDAHSLSGLMLPTIDPLALVNLKGDETRQRFQCAS